MSNETPSDATSFGAIFNPNVELGHIQKKTEGTGSIISIMAEQVSVTMPSERALTDANYLVATVDNNQDEEFHEDRHVRVERKFEDSLTRDAIVEFTSMLLKEIYKENTLKGVQHHLNVYHYEDRAEKVTLIRFELHVPGLEGSYHRNYWKQFSLTFQKAINDYGKESGRTPKGRRFKEISKGLSSAIIPY
jgi:hypothetical protein